MGEFFFNVMILKKKPYKVNFSLSTTKMSEQRYESIDDWFDPFIIEKSIYFS